MELIHEKGPDGRTPLLILQPYAFRPFQDDMDVESFVDQIRRLGCGFIYTTVMPELVRGPPPVVDNAFLAQHRERLQRLIHNSGATTLVTLGQNLTRTLSEAMRIEQPASKRVLNYPTKYRVSADKEIVGIGLAPPQMLMSRYQEKALLNEQLVKIKTMVEDRGYEREGNVRVLETHDQIKSFLMHLQTKHKGLVSFDTETRNLNFTNNTTLCTMQFAMDDKTGYVIYWDHEYNKRDRERDNRELRPLFERLFSSNSTTLRGWIMHNAQFDMQQVRAEFKVEFAKTVYDTMLLLHMMDQGRGEADRVAAHYDKPYALKQAVLEFLGYHGYDAETLAARKNGVVADLPKDKLDRYAGQDGFITFRLFQFLIAWARFIGYDKKLILFANIVSSNALKTFSVMSQNGMNIDREHLETMKLPTSRIQTALREINDKLRNDPMVKAVNDELVCKKTNTKYFWGDTPWMFSLGKSAHRVALFYDSEHGRQYPELENVKTKKKEKTCSKAFTAKYKSEDHLVKTLSEFSEIEKLNNAYVTSMSAAYDNARLLKTDYADGKAHCRYLLSGTQTGRLSCVSPNLQQIPRAESPLKTEVKNIFCSDPQGAILQADFAAAEVRMWGSLSHDKFLIDLLVESCNMRAKYRENPTDESLRERAEMMADIHKQTASLMFNVALADVTKPLRSVTKSIVFGLIYGRGMPSIAEQLGKTVEETEALCAQFFKQFPQGIAWLEEMQQFCAQHGYVETPFGRRRYLPFVFDNDRARVQAALRRSINTPVQSCTGDFATLSISLLYNELRRKNMTKHFWLVNAVHDSTLLRIPKSKDAIAEVAPIVRDCFTVKSREILRDHFGFWLEAPMDVDMEVSQDKAWKCIDCGTQYKHYKSCCDGHKKGPDGKDLKDENDKPIKCKSERRIEVALNGGWGTLIGIDETEHGYAAAASGFKTRAA
jgi:DNA polymerase I-like protein with 3'-5' exonuclease and polymerase domains